jgi:hypothetical protein
MREGYFMSDSGEDKKIISDVLACLRWGRKEREISDKIEFLFQGESKLDNNCPTNRRGIYWITDKETDDFLCIIEVDRGRIPEEDTFYLSQRWSRIKQGVPYYKVDSYEEALRIITMIWREFA